MNYIKRLEKENEELTKKLEIAEQGARELKGYLLSPKFHEDTTVQVKDVLMRLEENDTAIFQAEV